MNIFFIIHLWKCREEAKELKLQLSKRKTSPTSEDIPPNITRYIPTFGFEESGLFFSFCLMFSLGLNNFKKKNF
jgi:hypothetical protein